jgi:ABC-type Fe3+/spermidine/putrescine transport system ATPase subunit
LPYPSLPPSYHRHHHQGTIEIRAIDFAYPNKPSQKILDQLTMTIEAGTMVGLMGESGSGKSTLFQLLQRFYDPTGGAIFLDGRDMREYNPMWLREQIAVVSQDIVIFPKTLRENLVCFICTYACSFLIPHMLTHSLYIATADLRLSQRTVGRTSGCGHESCQAVRHHLCFGTFSGGGKSFFHSCVSFLRVLSAHPSSSYVSFLCLFFGTAPYVF